MIGVKFIQGQGRGTESHKIISTKQVVQIQDLIIKRI